MSTTTPDFTFEMQARQFAALVRPVLPHADTSRHGLEVLQAIRFSSAAGYIIATATDRYTVGFQRVAVPDVEAGLGVTLPLAAVKRILSIFKVTRHDDPLLQFSLSDDTLTVAASGGLGGMVGARIALMTEPNEYPTISPTVATAFQKATDQAELVALNPAFLARFAAAQVDGEPVVLRIRGRYESVGVMVGEDFLGAIQPMRSDGAESREAWTDLLETKVAEKAA